MRTTSPRFYLRGDEAVLLSSSPTVGAAVARFATAAFGVVLILAGVRVAEGFLPLPAWAFPVAAGVAAVLVVAAALAAWRWYITTEYVVTDSRIYARTGRLRTHLHFTTHDKVTDVRYHQGVLGRIAGVSDVRFMTAGGDVTIVGVADALAVKETAENAREAFIRTLLERAGVEETLRRGRAAAKRAPEPEAAAPAPARSPQEQATEGPPPPAPLPTAPAVTGAPAPDYVKRGDRVLWTGKPRLIAAVGATLPALAAIVFFGGPSLVNPSASFVAPLIVVGAIALVAYRVLQLKYTEYVVSDQRVYMRSGVVGTTVKQLTYEKITDITYRQDVFGRVLGYAGLTVNTAGSTEAPVVMVGLWDALDVKELVEKARAHAIDGDEDEA